MDTAHRPGKGAILVALWVFGAGMRQAAAAALPRPYPIISFEQKNWSGT